VSMLNRKHAPINHDPGWLTLNSRVETEPKIRYEHAMPPSPKHANRPRRFPRTSASNELRTSEGTIKNPVLVTRENGEQYIAPNASFKPKSIKTKKNAKQDYAATKKNERAMPIMVTSIGVNNSDVD
jgi:hypothetical protein